MVFYIPAERIHSQVFILFQTLKTSKTLHRFTKKRHIPFISASLSNNFSKASPPGSSFPSAANKAMSSSGNRLSENIQQQHFYLTFSELILAMEGGGG